MGMVVMKPGLVTPEKKKNLSWLGRDVAAMQSSVDQCNLNHVPETVRRVLESEAWREFWRNTLIRFSSFREFITTSKRDGGCGWKPDYVEALLKKSGDKEVLVMYRNAITRKKGTNQYTKVDSDNVTIQPERGNSIAYTLDRLSRENEDLFEKVKAGELSANAAAKKAGFRKPPSPLKQLRKWWSKASADERTTFLAEITTREDRAA
jgi:hypothetical protein